MTGSDLTKRAVISIMASFMVWVGNSDAQDKKHLSPPEEQIVWESELLKEYVEKWNTRSSPFVTIESGEHTSISELIPSPNARRLAVVVETKDSTIAMAWDAQKLRTGAPAEKVRNHAARLLMDGKEIAVHDRILRLIFSGDGEHIAYAVSTGGKLSLIVDGKDMGPVSGMTAIFEGTFCFSPDGKRFAYASGNSTGEADATYLILDGQKQGPWKYIRNITLSPDGKRLAHVGIAGGGQSFVVDGKKMGPFQRCSDLCFSPDSRRFACIAKRDESPKSVYVLDGEKECGPWEWANRLTFSPDSRRLAWLAGPLGGGPQKGASLYVDGKEVCDGVDVFEGAVFSPDSKHLAYLHKEGDGWSVISDSIRSGPWDACRFLTFDWESRSLAFAEKRRAEWFIVVNDKPVAPYDEVHGLLAVDKDTFVSVVSKKVGATAQQCIATSHGLEGPSYDVILPDRRYGTPQLSVEKGSAYFAAIRGNSVLLVKQPLR